MAITTQTREDVMGHTSMVHVRIDDEFKAQATEALEAMGLSVSDAVRILLKRVVAEQAFPLELKVPNAATREAMAEARTIRQTRRARFSSAEAIFDDLEENAHQNGNKDKTRGTRLCSIAVSF